MVLARAPARLRLLTAALCALPFATACSKKPDVVRISRVLVDAPRELDDVAGIRDAIRAGVRERIAASPRAEVVEDARDATHLVRLALERVVEVPVFDKPAAAAALEEDSPPPKMRQVRPVIVELRPTGAQTAYEAVGRGSADGETLAATLSGFEDAWGVLGRQRRLDVEGTDAMVVAVGDADVRVRDFAIQRAGDRKLGEAVPALLRRLEEETHPQLVLRTVGSLVAIGDERAVAPLIDLTYQRSPAFVLQIVFAVAGIGGRTAEGFLVTLAGGHPVPEVRQGATEALAEMSARAKGN